MMDSTAENTSADQDAIEKMKDVVLEQIKAQGSHISKATKDAYRPALADYKIWNIPLRTEQPFLDLWLRWLSSLIAIAFSLFLVEVLR